MSKIKILTQWQANSYDVWGNKNDGFEVNNVFKGDTVDIVIELNCHNQGKSSEFYSGQPTDLQIKKALDINPRIQIEDNIQSENKCYPEHASAGYPLGELELVSHDSLCFEPIKLVIGHTWVKRNDFEHGLYFTLANGGSLYGGYIAKADKWCCYPVDTDPQWSQTNSVKCAKSDLMENAIATFKTSYQFTVKYVSDLD